MANGVSLERVGWHGLASTAAAITAIITLFTVVFLFGKGQARLDSVERQVQTINATVDQIQTTVTAQAIGQSALSANAAHVGKRLERITDQLDAIAR
jgi:outer membrane murein-binding lipoprotein Lpp